MIVECLCIVFFGLANLLLGILPTFPSFETLNVSIASVLYVFGLVNNFVSVSLLGNCLLIILIVCNIRFVWSILMWLVRKIPFIS